MNIIHDEEYIKNPKTRINIQQLFISSRHFIGPSSYIANGKYS